MTGSMSIGQGNYWLNSWMQQSMMGGDDTFMGLGPVCNDSLFGGGFGGGMTMPGMGGGFGGGMTMPGMGFGGGGMMGGMPFMGGFPGMGGANMNIDQYLVQQEKMQDFQIDSQVRYQKKMNAAQFAVQSDDDSITRQAGILQSQIKANNQDQVMSEYNKLVQAAQTKLESGGQLSGLNKEKSRAAVQAYAEKLYFQATGKSVIDDLRENGDSTFVHGLKSFIPGIANKRNAEENIADITGTQVETANKVAKGAGNVASYALVGAAAGSFIPGVGTLIGAGVGAAVGLIRSFFG